MQDQIDAPWFIQRGDQRYECPDEPTLRDWYRTGRVLPTDQVFHPSLGAWATAAQVVGHPVATARRTQNYMLVLIPIILIGSCFATTMFVGGIGVVQEAGVKRKLPDEFQRAEAELRANNVEAARAHYQSIESMVSSTSLRDAQAKAKAGVAATLALQGDRAGAEEAFKEAIGLDEGVEPATSAGIVMSAYFEAKNEVVAEKEARDRAASLGTAPNDFDVKWAVKSYAQENFHDPDVEVIDVGTPHATDSGSWRISVRLRAKNSYGASINKSVTVYMKDDAVVMMTE